MLNDALVLFVPLCALYIAAQVHHARDMRDRIQHAIDATREHRLTVEMYYAEFRKLPQDANEIGLDGKTFYPDGGYYELEPGGNIRIRLAVKPKRKNGAIVLTPKFAEEESSWKCEIEGDISRNYLPSLCRQ